MQAPATTHHLAIDGMTGDACIHKVRNALNGVSGLTVENVKVGSTAFACATPAQSEAACAAIAAVGFRATETKSAAATNGTVHPKDAGQKAPEPQQSKASNAMTSEGGGGAINHPTTDKAAVPHASPVSTPAANPASTPAPTPLVANPAVVIKPVDPAPVAARKS